MIKGENFPAEDKHLRTRNMIPTEHDLSHYERTNIHTGRTQNQGQSAYPPLHLHHRCQGSRQDLHELALPPHPRAHDHLLGEEKNQNFR